jgi:hypothetical protein
MRKFSAVLVTVACVFFTGATAWSQTNFYVNGALGSDTYDGLSSTFTGGNSGPKATIQAAIDAASSGDIVNVSAGTYVEDLTISASKTNLELSGSGSGSTTIQGIANVPVASFPLAVPNIEIRASGVKVHGFTIKGPSHVTGYYASGMVIGAAGVEVYDNAFEVTSADNLDEISQGIQTYSTTAVPGVDISGLNIHDNTFTNLGATTAGYEGVYINPDAQTSTATVTKNTFSGAIVRAITTERSKTMISDNSIVTELAPYDGATNFGYQGINVTGSGTVSAVAITGNTVKGSTSGKGFKWGLNIGPSTAMTYTSLTVSNNIIETNETGIRVRQSANGITVSDNSISGNTVIGIQNDDGVHTLDASGNWWGTTTVVATSVSAGVDYTPWLNSGTDTNTGATGFQGDFSVLNVSAGSPQATATGRIQEGINLVSGSTVNVLAGTYVEDVSIPASKANLDLTGAGLATTTLKGVQNVLSTSFPLAVPNIDILANGVKLHGFTIEGPNPVAGRYASGMVIGGSNVEIYSNAFKVPNASNTDDISQAIQTYRDGNGGAGDLSGLNIHDNTFTSLGSGTHGYEGIYINHTSTDPTPASTVTITNNQFTGNIFRGITSERSKTAISNNTITTDNVVANTFQGINVVDANNREQKNVTVTGNTVKGSASGNGFGVGIRIGGASNAQTLSSISATNNIVQMDSIGVLVRSSSGGVVVNGNDLSGNSTYAVKNEPAAVLNASGNWWGSALEASVTSAITGSVDYTPWLNSGTDTNTGATGFQGDFSVLNVSAASPQAAGTGRIQEGIDLVSGSTVNVAAGTYNETVTVNKAITLTGSGTPTIQNLTMNPGPLALGGNFQISGTLTLTSGNITTGADTLIVSSTGSVSRTSGYIIGNLSKNVSIGSGVARTFEIGTASRYNPVSVTFGTVTTTGKVTARANAGDHGSLGSSTVDPNKSVNVNWTFGKDGTLAFDNYSAVFNFNNPGDLDAGVNTSNLIIGKYNDPTWTYPTVGTRTTTSTEATGMTSFSDFQIGEEAVPSTIVSDDFNAFTLNQSRWRFINPHGDGTQTMTGTGTSNAWV